MANMILAFTYRARRAAGSVEKETASAGRSANIKYSAINERDTAAISLRGPNHRETLHLECEVHSP